MEKAGNIILEVIDDLLSTKVSTDIHIRINDNLCSEKEFEILFKQFTKGTFLERANLQVESFKPSITCGCGHREPYKGDKNYIKCPKCGKFANITDKSYEIIKPQPAN